MNNRHDLETSVGEYKIPREVQYQGDTVIILPYLEKHRPENQTKIEGIPINPCLRSGFDCTDITHRDSLEMEDWFDVPFIVHISWEDQEQQKRTLRATSQQSRNVSDQHFEDSLATIRELWFSQYPNGICYRVRCLDGGAPDRPTDWGDALTQEDAIELARKGPSWRR